MPGVDRHVTMGTAVARQYFEENGDDKVAMCHVRQHGVERVCSVLTVLPFFT